MNVPVQDNGSELRIKMVSYADTSFTDDEKFTREQYFKKMLIRRVRSGFFGIGFIFIILAMWPFLSKYQNGGVMGVFRSAHLFRSPEVSYTPIPTHGFLIGGLKMPRLDISHKKKISTSEKKKHI